MKSVAKLFSIIALITVTTYVIKDKTQQNSLRILEETTLGDYTITDSETKKKNCQDYEESDIVIDEKTREEKFGDGGMLSLIAEELEKILKNPDQDLTEGGQDVLKKAWYLAIPIIFLAIGILCFFFQIVFFWCRCLCKCLCFCLCSKDKNKNQAQNQQNGGESQNSGKKEKQTKCQCCICYSGLVLSGISLVLFIVWAVYAGQTVNSMSLVQCSSSTLFSDLNNGISDEGITFPGLKGMVYYLDTTATELKTLDNSISTNLDNILGRNLDTKGDDANTGYTNYIDNVKPRSVFSCDTGGASDSTVPTSIANVEEITSPVKANIETLKEAGDQIHSGTSTLKENIDNNSIDQYVKPLEDFKKTLEDDLIKIVDDFDKQVNEDYSFENFKSYVIIGLAVFTILILGLIIFYAFVMLFTLGLGKCVTCGNFLNIFISIFKSLVGSLFLLLGILLFITATLVSSVCYIMNKALNDEETAKAIFRDDNYKYYETCIKAGGDGKLTTALGFDSNQGFNDIQDLLDSYTIDIPEVSLTVAIDEYENYLGQLKTFDTNYDFAEEPSKGPLARIEAAQSLISCTDNEWALNQKDCSSAAQANIPTSENQFNSVAACVVIPDFPSTTMSSRYDGTCADSDKSQIYAIFNNNLYDCLKETTASGNTNGYIQTITDMETQYGTEIKTKSGALSDGIKDSEADIQVVRDKLDKTIEFMASFTGGFDSILNCTIFRREMLIFQNAVCLEFSRKLIPTTIVMIIAGPFYILLGICVFCTVVCSKDRKNLPGFKGSSQKNNNAEAKYRKPDEEQPQVQNVNYPNNPQESDSEEYVRYSSSSD